MTTKEAIRILDRRTTIPDNDVSWEEINKAIDLAIKALEANTCDEREKGNCPFYTARGEL